MKNNNLLKHLAPSIYNYIKYSSFSLAVQKIKIKKKQRQKFIFFILVSFLKGFYCPTTQWASRPSDLDFLPQESRFYLYESPQVTRALKKSG